MNSTAPVIPTVLSNHAIQTILDARRNLQTTFESLTRTLAAYGSDEDDYRLPGWRIQHAATEQTLKRLDGLMSEAYAVAFAASDCGNCSPYSGVPHKAHAAACSCGCTATVRVKEVRR